MSTTVLLSLALTTSLLESHFGQLSILWTMDLLVGVKTCVTPRAQPSSQVWIRNSRGRRRGRSPHPLLSSCAPPAVVVVPSSPEEERPRGRSVGVLVAREPPLQLLYLLRELLNLFGLTGHDGTKLADVARGHATGRAESSTSLLSQSYSNDIARSRRLFAPTSHSLD